MNEVGVDLNFLVAYQYDEVDMRPVRKIFHRKYENKCTERIREVLKFQWDTIAIFVSMPQHQ